MLWSTAQQPHPPGCSAQKGRLVCSGACGGVAAGAACTVSTIPSTVDRRSCLAASASAADSVTAARCSLLAAGAQPGAGTHCSTARAAASCSSTPFTSAPGRTAGTACLGGQLHSSGQHCLCPRYSVSAGLVPCSCRCQGYLECQEQQQHRLLPQAAAHLRQRCRCSRWVWPSRSRAPCCAPGALAAALPMPQLPLHPR